MKQLANRCKGVGRGKHECQHVCKGVCGVCCCVQRKPRVTQAIVVNAAGVQGKPGFAGLLASVSHVKYVKDSAVGRMWINAILASHGVKQFKESV